MSNISNLKQIIGAIIAFLFIPVPSAGIYSLALIFTSQFGQLWSNPSTKVNITTNAIL